MLTSGSPFRRLLFKATIAAIFGAVALSAPPVAQAAEICGGTVCLGSCSDEEEQYNACTQNGSFPSCLPESCGGIEPEQCASTVAVRCAPSD